MSELEQIRRQIQAVQGELKYLTRLLSVVRDPQTKQLALQQLQSQMGYLTFLTGLLSQRRASVESGGLPSGGSSWRSGSPAAAPPRGGGLTPTAEASPVEEAPPGSAPTSPPSRTFSRAELATYTGRNGRPAYVAVGGTVYDVTNNRAWSLATHFGLQAGRDLTAEFASCHGAQQWILGTLTPVGRLA